MAAHLPVLTWGIVSLGSGFFGKALIRAPKNCTKIALTFDDGPDQRLTPDILELLAEFNIQATFFVIAQKVTANQNLTRAISDAGHTVACHDLHHHWSSNFRGRKALANDISHSLSIVGDCIGCQPRLYRPPVGLTNPHTFAVLETLGLTCVGWSHAPRDRGNRSRAGIARIAALAGPGRVVLLHDSLPKPEFKDNCIGSLRNLCEAVATAGLGAVTVDTLFGIKPYEET